MFVTSSRYVTLLATTFPLLVILVVRVVVNTKTALLFWGAWIVLCALVDVYAVLFLAIISVSIFANAFIITVCVSNTLSSFPRTRSPTFFFCLFWFFDNN